MVISMRYVACSRRVAAGLPYLNHDISDELALLDKLMRLSSSTKRKRGGDCMLDQVSLEPPIKVCDRLLPDFLWQLVNNKESHRRAAHYHRKEIETCFRIAGPVNYG